MSFFISKKIILLIAATIILDVIKTEKRLSKSSRSIRFLIEEKENSLITIEENNHAINEKSKDDYLLETINQNKPFRFFQTAADSDGFKVRCFWLDSKTMRVFDLSSLKTSK